MKTFKQFINEDKIDTTKHQVGHYNRKGEFKVFSTHDSFMDARKSWETFKGKNKKATIRHPYMASDGQVSAGSVMDIHRNKE